MLELLRKLRGDAAALPPRASGRQIALAWLLAISHLLAQGAKANFRFNVLGRVVVSATRQDGSHGFHHLRLACVKKKPDGGVAL